MPISDLFQNPDTTDYIRVMRVFTSVDSCGRPTRKFMTVVVGQADFMAAINSEPDPEPE